MAVVKNFWLRDNKQKLGGAVIYQANGQTLMRQLAPSVSNPRTDAQMETRVKLANLVAFYRASAGWMRGAFETKPNNQSDYNAFVSANATSNNVWLTKSQVDAGNAIVAPYVVTRGSLGEVLQSANGNRISTNLYLGALVIVESTTIAQFSAALLANNNGINEGDQISFIQYIQNTSTDGNYTIVCRKYEVILSLTSTEALGNYLPVDIVQEDGAEQNALSVDTADFVGGVAFILSRTYGGRILVSSSSVTLTSNNTVYTAMTSTNQKNTAIRSYGSNTVVFLDSNLADTANSSVNTAARVLSFTVRGREYTPGSLIPREYYDEEQVYITLSAPVSLQEGASLRLNNSTGENIIDFDKTPFAASVGNQFVFSCSAPGTIPYSTDVTLQIISGGEVVISESFETESSNGEGLG